MRVLVIFSFIFAQALFPFAAVVEDLVAVGQRTAEFLETAARWKQQAEQFVQQAKNFEQQVAGLGKLNWKDLLKLNTFIDDATRFESSLLNKASSYRTAANQFDRVYGNQGNLSYAEREKQWSNRLNNSLKDSFRSFGVQAKATDKLSELEASINLLKDANGNLKAIQAAGKIAKIQALYLQEISALVRRDAEVKTAESAKRAGEDEAAKKAHREFFSSKTPLKKPAPSISRFPKIDGSKR